MPVSVSVNDPCFYVGVLQGGICCIYVLTVASHQALLDWGGLPCCAFN